MITLSDCHTLSVCIDSGQISHAAVRTQSYVGNLLTAYRLIELLFSLFPAKRF